MENNKISRDIRIACYDTDSNQILKPASFMDYAQELAGEHTEILGFGYDDLISRGFVWIVSRMRLVYYGYPHWRDRVVLSTWHRGPQGPFYIRDYEMRSTSGELLVASTSSWLVFDLEKRKLVRQPLPMAEDSAYFCTDQALEPLRHKLRVPPAGLEPCGSHIVRYNDVDKNLHANNPMYVRWAMDALDPALLTGSRVREMEIDFVNEARLGQKVELVSLRENDSVYVVGKLENGDVSFISRFVI